MKGIKNGTGTTVGSRITDIGERDPEFADSELCQGSTSHVRDRPTSVSRRVFFFRRLKPPGKILSFAVIPRLSISPVVRLTNAIF